jgi:tetraacyldisaccharide 4'-kinase
MSKEIDIRPFQHLFFSTLEYLSLKPVFDNTINKLNIESLKDFNVLALSGIARSKSYADFLIDNCKSVKHLRFSDHHNFTKKDIAQIELEFKKIHDKKIIIVTEKDAIRLNSIDLFGEEIKNYVYCIPIEVKLLCSDDEKKHFDKQIFSYVRNNKRYSKLYKDSY